MDEILKDNRFKHISSDSRFKIMPKNQRKFKLDNRFKRMFHDKKFKLKYSVDKRGRPVNLSTNENLKKFYELSSESESDAEQKEEKADKNNQNLQSKDVKNKLEKENDKNDSTCESDEEENYKKDKDSSSDESKSSTDESENSDDDSDEESNIVEEIPWNEFDKDTIREDKISSRLAVCNMDWDRIKATDIFVLLNSFKPSNGVIKSVKIYLSEFGKQRTEYEKLHGPTELTSNDVSKEVILEAENKNIEDSISDKEQGNESYDYDSNNEEEGSNYDRYKLRKYQFNRLKYYYAVVECDSAETANKIYTECDGMEYESSCTRLDLRFIPAETIFDETPTQICLDAPDPVAYKPDLFITTALNQTKVECTWDETPRDRLALTMRSYTESDLKNSNFKNILATSSEEEDYNDASDEHKLDKKINIDNKEKIESENKSTDKESENDRIKKYRDLLLGLGQKSKKVREGDLEFSWEGGIEEEGFSDLLFNSKKKSNDKKNNKYKETGKNEIVDLKEQAKLSLLTIDLETKNHFNLDELITDKARNPKKKLGKRKDEESDKKDDFNININDSRFEAMFTDHNFNIDPSNPSFKNTNAMEKLIEEKLKRKSDNKEDNLEKFLENKEDKTNNNSEISLMIKAIKSKTEVLKRNEKKIKR